MNLPNIHAFRTGWLISFAIILSHIAFTAMPADTDNVAFGAELKYAEKLAGQMQFDMAKDICENIIKAASDDRTRFSANLALARIIKTEARFVLSQELHNTLKDQALVILKEIIKKYPDDPDSADAKFEIAEILLDHTAGLQERIKKESDIEVKIKLKQELENTYSEALRYLKEMIDKYNDELSKPNNPVRAEELTENLMEAEYRYGVNHYYYGISYDKGSDRFKSVLQEGIKNLEAFIQKYENSRAFDAAYYCGLCYYELGDYKKAAEYFNMASHVFIRWLKVNAPRPEEALEELKESIQKAFWNYARNANAIKDYKLAIKIVDDLIKEFPQSRDYYMELALIEQAYAYHSIGDKKGLETIRTIASGGTGAARYAGEIIERIIDEGKNITPDMMLISINNAFDKRKYPEAIAKAQALMNMLSDAPDEEKAKYLPQAFFLMGESFRLQKPGRYYEAIIAYEGIYLNPKYKNIKYEASCYGAVAMKLAAECYLVMGIKGDDPEGRQKHLELMKLLAETWPDSPEAQESSYNLAESLRLEGKYTEAAQAYKKVPPASRYYIDARFQCGYMYYLRQAFAFAEEELKGFIGFAEERTAEPTCSDNDKARIRRYELLSYTLIGRIYTHDTIRKYNEAIALMEKAGQKFKTAQEKPSLLEITITAYAGLGQMDKAEEAVETLRRTVKSPDIMAPIYQLMAFTYERIAYEVVVPASNGKREKLLDRIEELRQNDKAEYQRFEQALTRSREYYARWAESSAQITASDALAVADKLYRTSEELDKPDFYGSSRKSVGNG
jgi:tetratricopeptide (TPR) repeat protein